jgi:type IV secretory pathway TrbD component
MDGRTDGDFHIRGHNLGGSSARLEMGCIALVLMLVAEFGFVLWIRGFSIRDYLATRDRLSGTVYFLMLAMFAVMPFLVPRR